MFLPAANFTLSFAIFSALPPKEALLATIVELGICFSSNFGRFTRDKFDSPLAATDYMFKNQNNDVLVNHHQNLEFTSIVYSPFFSTTIENTFSNVVCQVLRLHKLV